MLFEEDQSWNKRSLTKRVSTGTVEDKVECNAQNMPSGLEEAVDNKMMIMT